MRKGVYPEGDTFMSQFGNKLEVVIDRENNSYIDRFEINKNIITKIKENSQTHQLFGIVPIPNSGKHYFTARALNLIDNTVRVGVLSGNNRFSQYCGNKQGCLCYSGNGAYIY